jgi:hypothetical protein
VKHSMVSPTLALLLMSFVFGAASWFSLTSSCVEAKAETAEATPLKASVPSGEEEITSDRLSFNVTSSTDTLTSHSVGVSVSSETTAYKNGIKYNNVYCVINDPTFISEEASSAAAGADTIPVFEGMVYTIFGTSRSYPNVVIPEYLTYASKFKLHITSISANCCGSNAGSSWDKYKNITSIVIPASIETIQKNAFASCPDTVTINCVSGAAKEGWAADWTDAKNVVYSYAPTAAESALLDVKSGGNRTFGKGENFIVGSYEDGDYRQPLQAVYNVLDGQGSVVEKDHVFEIPLSSLNNPYDAVGSSVGSNRLNLSFVLEVEAGQKVDMTSLTFHNIREVTSITTDAGKIFAPDLTGKIYYAKPALSFPATYQLDQFITYKTTQVAVFAKYTSVDLSIDKVDNTYKMLNPSMYASNSKLLASGTVISRYQFSSFNLTKFRLTYRSQGVIKSELVRVVTPIDFLVLSEAKNNTFGFLLDNTTINSDFNVGNLISIDLVGFTLKLDLFNTSSHSLVTKSGVTTTFGSINLYSEADAASYHQVDVVRLVLLSLLIYVLVYLAGTLAYYFYAKNKYKNDEFRRVNSKRFFITAGKNGFGFALILLAIVFIYARWGIMNSTIVTYNPLDVYVIIFTLFGAIFLGFFIKNTVVAIKNAAKRAEAIRLNLGNDVVDDGTK